jgi:hypothetical protein
MQNDINPTHLIVMGRSYFDSENGGETLEILSWNVRYPWTVSFRNSSRDQFDWKLGMPANRSGRKKKFSIHSRESKPNITQNYCDFGYFPSSCVLGSRDTTFRKLDLFPSSREGGENTPQSGLLELADLKYILTFNS